MWFNDSCMSRRKPASDRRSSFLSCNAPITAVITIPAASINGKDQASTNRCAIDISATTMTKQEDKRNPKTKDFDAGYRQQAPAVLIHL
jgi:hypothetical protein